MSENNKISSNPLSKVKPQDKQFLHLVNPNYSKCPTRILSYFICDQKAKIIIARQFTETTKKELFEYAVFFSRNVEELIKTNQTCLTYDDPSKMCVFQILNKELFSVLVISYDMNIFEASDIIKLIYRTISDQLKHADITPSILKENAFEIVLAIDDIVNFTNGKEETSLHVIKENLQMHSTNEKHENVVLKDKENKARENMIKGMEEIERMRRENKYVESSVSSDQIALKEQLIEQAHQIRMETIAEAKRVIRGMDLKSRLVHHIMMQREQEEDRISKKLKIKDRQFYVCLPRHDTKHDSKRNKKYSKR
jgi:hypothetical protein